MQLAGALLKRIMLDPEGALDIWAKLRTNYFSSSHQVLYKLMRKYYDKYTNLPTFEALKTQIRDTQTLNLIYALQELEVDLTIPLIAIFDSFLAEYTQNLAIDQIDKFLDEITFLDTVEIKTKFTDIALFLDEKTHSDEMVFSMADVAFANPEDTGTRISLGISDKLDATKGIGNTDLVFIGGKRGSGKSVVGCNIAVEQFKAGNTTIFFSIEMRAIEVYQRFMSILSGVPHDSIKQGTMNFSEQELYAKARCDFFVNGEEAFVEFLKNRDLKALEELLLKSYQLKPDNQIILVDNRELSISDIDLHLHKAKSRFGDKLQCVVVDYVNQLVPANITKAVDMYNWQEQVAMSKELKNLARKYETCIVSPYQIDANGEARFSKGLLDAVDLALVLKAESDRIEFSTTKSRSMQALDFATSINWNTLTLGDDYIEFISEEENNEGDLTPW